jgi:hypothetical protein
MDANTVPDSIRCKPSTRMSRTVKGSTAQAGMHAIKVAAKLIAAG